MNHRALPLSIVETLAREQRTAWPGCTENCRRGRECSCVPATPPAEMAVYDPSDDDQRPPMTSRTAFVSIGIYMLSCGFVAWLLAVLSAYFGALPR